MKKKIWKIEKHSMVDKSFKIYGPGDFTMIIDFDDVNHKEVNKITRKIVKILNRFWNEDLDKFHLMYNNDTEKNDEGNWFIPSCSFDKYGNLVMENGKKVNKEKY